MIFNLIEHAKQLLYDNSKSGLSATDTQGAIDEISGDLTSRLAFKGYLTTTVNAVLDDGIYIMNGSNAIGTFPDLNNAKYGVMMAIKRGDSSYQQLQCQGGFATRRVDKNGTILPWLIGSYRREVHEVENINIVANGYIETTITFDSAFTCIPMVSVDLRGAGTRTLTQLQNVSTSDCRVRLYAENGEAQTERGIRVIAMGY